VLLKNDGNVLPLDKQKIKTVLMVGPDAYPGEPVGAGSARVVPFAAVSPLQGISSFLGSSVNVFYEAGLPSVVAALSNSAISRLLRRRRRRWRPAAGRRFIPWLSTLTNTGSRAGSEVAQVYVGEAKPSVPRPAKELKGFSRVELAAGETKHLTMSLDVRAFAFYDVAGKH